MSLKPKRSEAALQLALRNGPLVLAVLFDTTDPSSAFVPTLSSLTVVGNAVTPEPTPSQSHPGSGDRADTGFRAGHPSLVRI